jgi:hypothetical protein
MYMSYIRFKPAELSTGFVNVKLGFHFSINYIRIGNVHRIHAFTLLVIRATR